jgi:hypothetical protein
MPPSSGVVREFEVRFDYPTRILIRLGCRKISLPEDDPVLAVVREEGLRAARLLRPAAAWRVIEAGETGGQPVFCRAERVGLCVCTIGPALEEECAAHFARNEDLRALALDALGSEAVSQVSRRMERFLTDHGRALGFQPGKRYAPGYKGWGVENQAFVFSRVPASEIGVRLTDSFMMVPRKSYSFRINFYPGPPPRRGR